MVKKVSPEDWAKFLKRMRAHDKALENWAENLENREARFGDMVGNMQNMFMQRTAELKLDMASQMDALTRGLLSTGQVAANLFERMSLVVQEKEKELQTVPPVHGDYISKEEEVSSGKPLLIEVIEQINREARYGSIVSDDGRVSLRINEREPVPILQGEVFNIKVEENMRISKIRVFTDSAASLTVRVFLA